MRTKAEIVAQILREVTNQHHIAAYELMRVLPVESARRVARLARLPLGEEDFAAWEAETLLDIDESARRMLELMRLRFNQRRYHALDEFIQLFAAYKFLLCHPDHDLYSMPHLQPRRDPVRERLLTYIKTQMDTGTWDELSESARRAYLRSIRISKKGHATHEVE